MIVVKGGQSNLESCPGCACGCIMEWPYENGVLRNCETDTGILLQDCQCGCGGYDQQSPGISADHSIHH